MAAMTPARSIFYHPRKPAPFHKVEMMRQLAGWELADSPETADWCMLFRDTTWLTLPESDPWAEVSAEWINGRCRDISKRKAERVFEAVFGYPLAIDPLTHHGACLRKSDKNYVKDAVVLACPIPNSEIDDTYAYERLVDSRIPGLGITELCPSVVGGDIVSVRRWIHPDWYGTRRLNRAILDEVVVYPDSVFSRQELEQISVYCGAMGLDFGELNMMRDRNDGRIYIFDANNTPSYDLDRVWATEELEQVLLAFEKSYPPRSAILEFSSAGGKADPSSGPNGASDRPDWANNMAARVNAQTGRIARIEAEVGELTAGMALLLAAQFAPSDAPAETNRKK